jgi:hypothetical protein
MSNFHVMQQDDRKRSIGVVFHVPVPATLTNTANVTWRDAVVKDQGGADNITSTLPDISQEELSAMKSGALIEVQRTVYFSTPNINNAERIAEIGQFYNNLKTDLIDEKMMTLQYIGYAGNVA